MYYTIKNRDVVLCSTEQWTEDFVNVPKRIVFKTTVGPHTIVTVFVGFYRMDYINRQLFLFETVIVGLSFNELYTRYCETYDEAEQLHIEAIDYCKNRSTNPHVTNEV